MRAIYILNKTVLIEIYYHTRVFIGTADNAPH